MKYLIAAAIFVGLLFIPMFPYYDCSTVLPPTDLHRGWEKEACNKERVSAFTWAVARF